MKLSTVLYMSEHTNKLNTFCSAKKLILVDVTKCVSETVMRHTAG